MVKKFPEDHRYMRIALALAEQGVGSTAPNPSVGCVLVKNGVIIGQGVTASGGRPHAETNAIMQAGATVKGATAYVTLEPCGHYGKTPPCAEALIAAKIARVVIAIADPHPNVNGAGVKLLQQAGIEVICGVEEQWAAEINQGFFMTLKENRPYITLKIASTMDGKIATHQHHSQWITGETARQYGHQLRAKNDAIMVGKNTVLHDKPALTCRLPGLEDRSPLRIVVGDNVTIPEEMYAAKIPTPLWVVTSQHQVEHVDKVVTVTRSDKGLDLVQAMQRLAEEGITRLLAEGGGTLAAHLLQHNLVDRIEWIQAPIILGDDGIPAIAAMGIGHLNDSKRFKRTVSCSLGQDMLTVLERA